MKIKIEADITKEVYRYVYDDLYKIVHKNLYNLAETLIHKYNLKKTDVDVMIEFVQAQINDGVYIEFGKF